MSRMSLCAGACLLATLLFAPASRALAADPGTAPAAPQGTLADVMKKQPYLIYPGNVAQMEVLWQLSATATSTIEWGTDTNYGAGNAANDEYGTDHQHAYTIGGLVPSTRYYYRVSTGGFAYTGSFVSAPAPGAQQLNFLAYGDTRTYPATHDQVAAAMNAVYGANPSYQTMALFMGDFVNTGNSETYWTNEFFSPTYTNIRALLANVPLQSAMGNHENSSPVLFTKYYPYPWVAGRYWSFDYGPIHVTVIDQYTAYTAGSAQLQWVANDLAASTKTWKFVLLHEPGWSSGNGHANNTSVQSLIEPLCEQNGVAILFAGHNHNYCRAVVNGVMHVTTGGGGAPLEAPLAGQPNVVVSAMLNHYCKIAIDGGVLRLQAINSANGALIDSFTLVRTVPDHTPPVVTLTSPVGGEDWKAGSVHAINWSATDNAGVSTVDLAYSTNSGATFPNVIAAGIGNAGTYAWTVPNAPGAAVRVRVQARDAAGNLGRDSSAADFTISRWLITASAGAGGSIAPEGAVMVNQGANQHFSIQAAPGNAVTAITVDGGALPPDTSYTFYNVTSNHTLLASFVDATAPLVHVTSPVGGEAWVEGSAHTITWSASDNLGVDSVSVDYSLTGIAGPWLAVARGLANSGALPWTVPGPATDSALVRVTAYDHALNAGSALSDSLFRIVDPNAGVGPDAHAVLALSRPQPNPAMGTTTVRFTLPHAGRARLEILDLGGRRLWQAESDLGAGAHAWRWDGHDARGGSAGAGLYFVRLVTPWGTRSERLIWLK